MENLSSQLPVVSCQWLVIQQPVASWGQGVTDHWLLAAGFYRSLSAYAEAGSAWFEVGPGTALPCSSIFIPRLNPIEERISLISFSDFRPKFFVFSISASVFCTSSPID